MRFLFAVAAFFFAIWTGNNLACADDLVAVRQKLDLDHQRRLDNLAQQCEEKNLPELADEVRAWFVPKRRRQQVLFLPSQDEPSLKEFAEIRSEYADSLYQLARQALEDGQLEMAWRLVHETIRENPNHRLARRTLGHQRRGSRWLTPFQAEQVRRRKIWHDQFGWVSKNDLKRYELGQRQIGKKWVREAAARHVNVDINHGWQIESSHFHITTNQSREAGVALAIELEELYTIWQQLFVRYVMNEAEMKRRFGGRGGVRRWPAKHKVMLFASKDQYIAYLRPFEPQISITLGIYLDGKRTSFLYAGDERSTPTWLHEVTHQLFHETNRVSRNVGGRANFWVVEGAALYMESLVHKDGYYTTGGALADRMQYARYRALSDEFYVPIQELCALGRRKLQRDKRIKQLYSQSAGIAHFLMDYEDGKYRPDLVKYLQAVYQGRDNQASLATLTGVDFDILDRQYHQFLGVTDADLINVAAPEKLLRLCLGHTQVTDAGLNLLPTLAHLQQLDLTDTAVTDDTLKSVSTLSQLDELDLSGTAISDAGISHLARLKNLKTLWLSGTNITGAGLARLKPLEQLEYVNISGTKVSQEEWDRFRQSMPHIADPQ